MPIFQDLKQFVRSENAHDRYIAIEKLAKNSQSWQGNLLTWQIMALIPTIVEKAKLAQSLNIPNMPSSEWAIVSHILLKETDENVISSCIATLAHSKSNSLIYRILNLIERTKLSNKAIYSLFTFAEETGNELLAEKLLQSFSEDLPDNILAKGFNAFIRLGIINQKYKEVALSILKQNNSDDLIKSSLPAALLYLGFASNKDDWKNVKNIILQFNNPETIRFFEILNSQIAIFEDKNFGIKACEHFIEKALHENNPSFIGYGILSQKNIEIALESLIKDYYNKKPEELTKTILKLKNKKCIEILANNSLIGIESIENGKNEFLAREWVHCIPYQSQKFIQSVQNPKNYKLWHSLSKDLAYIFLNADILLSNSWQEMFEKSYDCNLLLNQIVAIGNKSSPENTSKLLIRQENKVIENLKKYVKFLTQKSSNEYEYFVEKVYAAIIGGNTSASFLRDVYKIMPFSGTSWAFTAIALTAPRLDIYTLSVAIHRELEIIKQTLLHGNMQKEEYILEVTSRFQSILVGADRFKLQVNQPTLVTLKEISSLIQNILDKTEEKNHLDEDSDSEVADWNGNSVIDRPILLWEAILQVCLNTQLSREEKDYYELFLREGLRIAPHVEKRWIVRALVKLDTDDAIKAILYQALQHIDNDFVEHTIVELLRSKHTRAQQALIRTISKQNISSAIKIKIIKEISLENPEEILQELKTLQLLRLPEEIDKEIQEAIARVSSKVINPQKPKNEKDTKISSQDIDLIIKSLIPYSSDLSIDSKSALRTAEMILIQSIDWGNEAVDLSPIVNMHCKAVELTMRDTFEAYTDALVRKGELSKKLDSIGYAKGTIDKMNSFEDYIANLPIIRSIPYFSKFKLRKMLRAICLYRPGKRFTLDGPKAFALLLLVAARKECQFNLNKMMNLGFESDIDLFEFIKLVHSLQDSRNRAVHEGLTWEARDEIESMRKQAYKIISTCLIIGRSLETFSHQKIYDSPMETF
ncbi:hypothetical protein [Fluviispira multicolorata]|uniref:Uncharacterized protein n=1 Tax=Fluviispira multicolorata TaxID=2654512 RepID=A0A833N297_9BACT|nr:hypothetical protein [Fluviispira multicolorata]KAB8027777.1 hypothetical protein GCL57_14315 [Fluviispira multicolorata]